MTVLDLNIGAQVHCEGEPCGKLVKVAVDPHTQRVTDLIVERGFLRKTGRVLPVSAVERTTDQDVYLSVSDDEFEGYPEYREMEFDKPTAGWGEGQRYKAEHTRFWISPRGPVRQEPPVVPTVRQRVHEGISSELEVVERGTPVNNAGGTIGEVDHVLIDHDTGEITHLVVRTSSAPLEIFPYYSVVPISMVEYVSEEGIFVEATDEELKELPHCRSRADVDILAELQDRLEALAFDSSDIQTTVEECVARITGVVQDGASKRRAEAAARSVAGVTDVENALHTDTAIVARVTTTLADDPRTGMAVIEVISERGTVTLKGSVDSPEIRKAAEEIAAEQPGVVSVINALEIEPDDYTEALKPWTTVRVHPPGRPGAPLT